VAKFDVKYSVSRRRSRKSRLHTIITVPFEVRSGYEPLRHCCLVSVASPSTLDPSLQTTRTTIISGAASCSLIQPADSWQRLCRVRRPIRTKNSTATQKKFSISSLLYPLLSSFLTRAILLSHLSVSFSTCSLAGLIIL
jgi:hypothetical protein